MPRGRVGCPAGARGDHQAGPSSATLAGLAANGRLTLTPALATLLAPHFRCAALGRCRT
jgi:hypothetical protein